VNLGAGTGYVHASSGARPQRLLWATTGTNHPGPTNSYPPTVATPRAWSESMRRSQARSGA
jgi:hypothetical protein